MAALYTDLITISDLQLEMEDFADIDFADVATQTAAEAIIHDVTALMEGGHLGIDRRIIVRAYTIYTNYGDWNYDPARSLWWIYAPQWPVVEIDTSGFTIGRSMDSREPGDLIMYASAYEGAITFYAGYKRSAQTLVGLQAESGLSALGTAPADLPYDMRGVAVEASMYKLFERRHGPGVTTRQINPAIQATTISGPRPMYLRDLMRERLHHYRRLPV